MTDIIDEESKIINLLTERLSFFFSNANLRQDKWMRSQLSTNTNNSSSPSNNAITLDDLLKFNTLKSILKDYPDNATKSKELLAKAAAGGGSEKLKELISYNEEKEEISRVVPFDFKTMGDGSYLSLYVKNVPLTTGAGSSSTTATESSEGKKEEDKSSGEVDKKEGDDKQPPQPPRYAVTRDEIKTLFEPYGTIGIIQLKYGRKQQHGGDGGHYSPANRDSPGVAIVEFENEEGIQKACKDLLISTDDDKIGGGADDNDNKVDNGDNNEEGGGEKVLEIKGNKLIIEKMKPHHFFKDKKKRGRDSSSGGGGDAETDEKEDETTSSAFEPITLEWEKGCVITLTGLSTTSCDRESIRDAVSDTLGVPNDVKTSGLYVDYNRGESTGNLRLTNAKPTEMTELVTKLNDGTITIGSEKVESSKILEGTEEEEYWKNFTEFLNKRKRMREEEKRMNNNKRQKFGKGGGRRGRGGRGGGGRGGRR